MTGLLLAVALATSPVMTGEYNGPWLVETARDARAVEREVLDADGRLVAGPFAADAFTVAGVRPWSAETPVWYRLATTLSDGTREETIFGFAEKVIRGSRLYVNGAPVRVKLGHKDLGGNAASVFNCTEDAAWTNGIYRLSEAHLSMLDPEKPRATDLATRHAFQDWSVTATNYGGRIVVRNGSSFLSAKDVTLRWTLLEDGEATDDGTIDLCGLRAGETSVFDMPSAVQSARFRGATVSVRFTVERDGRAIAVDQADLALSREVTPVGTEKEGFIASHTPDFLKPDFLIPDFLKAKVAYAEEETDAGRVKRFTTRSSRLEYDETMPYCGVRYVARGLLSDTSLAEGVSVRRGKPVAVRPRWDLVHPPTPVAERDGAKSLSQARERGGVAAEIRWTVYPAGDVAVEARLEKADGEKDAERLGLSFFLPQGPESLRWFGLGPGATAEGATEGAFLGVWETELGGPFTAEAVRGIRLEDLTVRTLGAPMAVRVSREEEGGLWLELFGEPGADGVVPLAFTLSVRDKALTARTPDGQ